MSSPQKTLRRTLQSWLGSAAVAGISRTSPALARALGRSCGRIGNRTARKTLRATRLHLDASLGSVLSDRELHALSRRVLPTIGAQVCEALVHSRWGIEETLARVRFEGLEAFRAAVAEGRARGRGLIALSGHFGHWETMAALLSHASEGTALCVARRYEVEGYQRVIETVRRRLGVQVMHQEDSLVPIVRTLRRGGVLGLLPDQDFKNLHDGLFVDFLHRPAYTTTTPAELALRTGASLLVATTHREGDRCIVRTTPAIDPASFQDAEDPVRALTEWWSRELSRTILAHPEHWVWMHRRWRTTPDRLQYRALRRKEREVKRARRDDPGRGEASGERKGSGRAGEPG